MPTATLAPQTKTKMTWTRNPAVESFLDAMKVKWQWVAEMPYAKLNIKESQKNNARISTKPVLEELMFPYAQAMEAGAAFPGLVTSKNGRGYYIHDGNNRMAAFDLAGLAGPEATVGCYVLLTDDAAALEFITRSLNRLNGKQQDQEEAIQQALAILDSQPDALHSEVGKVFGLAQSTISNAVKAREVATMLRERKMNPESLPRSVLTHLGKLRRHEPVMAVAADVAIERELTGEQTKDMIDAALAHNSEAKMIGAVNEYDKGLDAMRAKAYSKRSNSTRASFLRSLHSLWTIMAKSPTLEHLQITSRSEAEQVKEDWLKLREAIDKAMGIKG